ncbi:hypothetical protein PR048_020854 [Dryococelus australis]|uniref:Uncharacterized protein n=1 Tax=Dryococelus australis TaxID=614101 RepID=A0ABQ9GWK3_9NEOP|nr:hypothetical protein PR048_020854 [Dryococelus australis]
MRHICCIVRRLHLQGTRTIVDNLDTGYEVTPILTSYQGAWDCYETTLSEEGVAGLYRGFGALMLQLAAHVAVLRMTKFVLTELSNLMSTNAKPTTSVHNPGAPPHTRVPYN